MSTLPVSSAATPSAHPAVAPDPQALRLGYAGLIPFVIGVLLAWLVEHDEAHDFVLRAINVYAAVIVSFLGALHWGLAMRAQPGESSAFVWGIVPALVGWVAALMPAGAGLVIQSALLIACYLVDRRAYPLHGAAGWLTLRFRLTVVATLSCLLAASFA